MNDHCDSFPGAQLSDLPKSNEISSLNNDWVKTIPKDDLIKLGKGRHPCIVSLNRHDGLVLHECVTPLDKSLLLSVCEQYVAVVDVKKKKLLRFNDVDLSKVIHKETLDLSVDGDRWEGDVLNNNPCGWGALYDKENHKVYEGFWVDDAPVCYGCFFHPFVEKKEYVGGICNGLRCGKGTQYDLNGDVIYDGEWIHNERCTEDVITVSPGNEIVHNYVVELTVCDDCYNSEEFTVLDLYSFPFLKTLTVGNKCFQSVTSMSVYGLSKLESLHIGEECFFNCKEGERNNYNNCLCIKDCPRLKVIVVGPFSFSSYTNCIIENVNAVERITIGSDDAEGNCFAYSSLQLQSTC